MCIIIIIKYWQKFNTSNATLKKRLEVRNYNTEKILNLQQNTADERKELHLPHTEVKTNVENLLDEGEMKRE